jgi:phage baseplate assembly protein V
MTGETQHLQNQIDRLYRRILMIAAPVMITATDDSEAVHRVQIRVNGTPEIIDRAAVMQIYGLASHAPTGTDATAIFVAGQRSNVVIVATGNQRYRLRDQKPGEVALYTDEGDHVHLARGKIIEIKAGEECRITTKKLTIKVEDVIEIEAPRIRIKGDIELDGNLTATGTVSGAG